MLRVMAISTLPVFLPLVVEGMVGGSVGVQASLGLTEKPEREQYLLPPSLVPPPHPARHRPWKIPVKRRPSLVLEIRPPGLVWESRADSPGLTSFLLATHPGV